MKSIYPKKPALKYGFTLVELLSVIAILGIIIAILIPTIGSMLQKAKQSSGQATMRDIGTGMRLYAADNNGRLPGQLWPGQVTENNPNDASNEGRLVNVISPYMDYPEPPTGGSIVVEAFAPPAFWDAVDSSAAATTRAYVIRELITVNGVGYRPFGAQLDTLTGADATNNPDGINAIRAEKALDVLANEWAMSDADQRHPGVAGKGWSASTVPEPYHGDTRNVLYFDGRVEALPLDEIVR